MEYTTPFQVKEGIIRDAGGRKVKLWGVNYYAPFNHNYFNIAELGKDHFKAIDEDLRHLKLLGADFLRMHLYEREITDPRGRLVENRQMEIFDYLIDQCEKQGIYLMLSPISYWNTVKNQIMIERQYAYWNIHSQDAFGFTNFYSIDSLIWHPEAQDCQERYIADLFERRNKFSGKRLNEYDNLVAWELVNEMIFPGEWLLEEPGPPTAARMSLATKSRGGLWREFMALWEDYRRRNTGARDDAKTCFHDFIAETINRYFDRFWGMVEDYFGEKVIRSQFLAYSGIPGAELARVVENNTHFNAESICTYLNANGFEAENTDGSNHLAMASEWFGRFAARPSGKRAAIAYEYDATGSVNGYPLAAIAAGYALADVQMAAYFTYTPYAVAAWNPGWLVHYLNIAHTPAKAAGFAAAGRIFRALDPGARVERGENEWHGEAFRIERENDFVSYLDDACFCYSNDSAIELPNAESLERVVGRGSSAFAESDTNGCYFLEKAGDGLWRLEIFPHHAYLRDPLRGKVYRGMANRYVDCTREPPVSQLSERLIRFTAKAFRLKGCTGDSGETFVVRDNTVFVPAGSYLLEAGNGWTEKG